MIANRSNYDGTMDEASTYVNLTNTPARVNMGVNAEKITEVDAKVGQGQ